MKKGSILFLKIVLLLIASAVLLWLIVFPRLEGRAVHLDLVSIYTDPFIIYIYIASIPFFVGLYQAFVFLNLINRNKAFSKAAITTLRNIRFSALNLIGFIIVAELYVHFFAHGDDPAGPTMLGLCAIIAAAAIVATTTVFQQLLQESKYKKA